MEVGYRLEEFGKEINPDREENSYGRENGNEPYLVTSVNISKEVFL
jgi:hypothetical protein